MCHCRYRTSAQSTLGWTKVRVPSPVSRSGASSPVVSLSQEMAAMGISTSRGKPDSSSPVPCSRVPHRSEFEQSPCGTPGPEALSTMTAVASRRSSSGEHAPFANAAKWSNTPVTPFDPGVSSNFGGREVPMQAPSEGDYWHHSAPLRYHYHSAGDITNLPLELQPSDPDRSILPSTLKTVQEDDVASDTDKVSTVLHHIGLL